MFWSRSPLQEEYCGGKCLSDHGRFIVWSRQLSMAEEEASEH